MTSVAMFLLPLSSKDIKRFHRFNTHPSCLITQLPTTSLIADTNLPEYSNNPNLAYGVPASETPRYAPAAHTEAKTSSGLTSVDLGLEAINSLLTLQETILQTLAPRRPQSPLPRGSAMEHVNYMNTYDTYINDYRINPRVYVTDRLYSKLVFNFHPLNVVLYESQTVPNAYRHICCNDTVSSVYGEVMVDSEGLRSPWVVPAYSHSHVYASTKPGCVTPLPNIVQMLQEIEESEDDSTAACFTAEQSEGPGSRKRVNFLKNIREDFSRHSSFSDGKEACVINTSTLVQCVSVWGGPVTLLPLLYTHEEGEGNPCCFGESDDEMEQLRQKFVLPRLCCARIQGSAFAQVRSAVWKQNDEQSIFVPELICTC